MYRLSEQTASRALKVFYVGQAQALRDRLSDHPQVSEDNPCIKRKVRNSNCYFDYVVIHSKPERDRVEQQEINHHRPECNRT